MDFFIKVFKKFADILGVFIWYICFLAMFIWIFFKIHETINHILICIGLVGNIKTIVLIATLMLILLFICSIALVIANDD